MAEFINKEQLEYEDLARRIAREFHDMSCQVNADFRKQWPSATRFVKAKWPAFLDAAHKMVSEARGEEFLIVNGEQIGKQEAMDLLRSLYHEAEEAAGEAHGKDRSEKFRANHPDETVYAKTHWRNYVHEARARFTAKLADPMISEEEKRRIHLALVLEVEIGRGHEKDNRLQLRRNTQQFEGDKFENKKIAEKFGSQPDSLKKLLMSSSGSLH